MAASIPPLKGKVLVQFGDREPVEIGEIEVPIEVSTRPKPSFGHQPGYRGTDIS